MPLQTHQTNRFRNFERVEERRQLYNELPKPAPLYAKAKKSLIMNTSKPCNANWI